MTRKRGSRNEPYESTVQGAFDDAKMVVESLLEELGDWRDNMEGAGMEAVPKYEEVSEAADLLDEAHSALEGVDISELADEIENAPVTTAQDTRRKASSRSGQALNATALLYAVKEELEAWTNRDLAFIKVGLSDDEADALDAANDTATETGDEVQNALDALESVSFPGMF